MALVTVQRSPSSNNSPQSIESSLGAPGDDVDTSRSSKSLSECYFAGKGTALVLPAEAHKSSRRTGANGSKIQKHLQSMFYLLRPEETLKMAVKLESVHPTRTRYLVVVSRIGVKAEESCLLGIDCNETTTVGLVLRVLADTKITLDGDGGFSVTVCGRHHIFKPVSVQAMWSALQTLHKVSSKARQENYYQGGVTHSWVSYYEERIESDRSCLNEWHAMDNLESRRPPSPDSVRTKPTERDETECVIRSTLKEIMMSVDLDEVTSKYIRGRLEEDLDMDLAEYKPFIDQEMLVILGQMDAPTEIFDHVYLGSEWNASNYEELQRNGVRHILNVTREIDNFFPGNFDYLNIRVYDDENTDLLKHWEDTFKYISKARQQGSKVLVHCKMGISRSASVVIAYAMKAYNWDFEKAMRHVKDKRNCIKPNTSFMKQLETYQGMLIAMKNKEKLQRSKSETNLKSPDSTRSSEKVLVGSEPTPIVQSQNLMKLQNHKSGHELRQTGSRPKSWSPDITTESNLLQETKLPQVSRSLENLTQKLEQNESHQKKEQTSLRKTLAKSLLARNVLLPCDNGESYSVSPNQIMHLPGSKEIEQPQSVKERISELESQKEKKKKKESEKKKLVLNLLPQFNEVKDDGKKDDDKKGDKKDDDAKDDKKEVISEEMQLKSAPSVLRAVLVKKEQWDPGEKEDKTSASTENTCDVQYNCVKSDEKQTLSNNSSLIVPNPNDNACTSNNIVPDVQLRTKTKKDGDPFSNQLDKVFDREERKHQRHSAAPTIPIHHESDDIKDSPSRQNSWSSYDSAVVLGYQGEKRDTPSRHSSWGSGDTRTLPSRNSSWGSYDIRTVPNSADILDSSSSGLFQYSKDEFPWCPGTVRRTKQKLEDGKIQNDNSENNASNNSDNIVEALNATLINNKTKNDEIERFQSSAISAKINIVQHKKKSSHASSQLSVSAPETSTMELVTQDCSLSRSASNVSNLLQNDVSSPNIISTSQCSSVKQHKTYLENLHKNPFSIQEKKKNDEQTSNILGIVRNRKKEFEAKNNIDPPKGGGSLPSSPILEKDRKDLNNSGSDTGEDLNLKKLIGKFENAKENQETVNLRTKTSPKPFTKNLRHSCYEVSVEKNSVIPNYKTSSIVENTDEYKRPPISPSNMVISTVISTAAVKKQQQFGKSHPLARLKIRPRHNSPVFNTM
ncbi:protein phosphatase Slingshot isoform X2 [Onthophagus taurus]|uniref:protein phosphatase Slingshot isoform X2 n=1 Tax=Onthophagus taurus TaxID=166361 RepID=UPI000C2007F3|nr:protein phosphatase Slingshot homolog 2 isoform X2 [Onthophagus taurus]